jgi:hypothetical protein
MSRGKQLQEMESASTPGQGGGAGSGAKQSRTAVNSGASAPDPTPSLSGSTPGQTGSWEDLGGPTPENYKPDDDSAKLKTPGTTLKQVRDVVNKGAKPAEAMKEEEDLEDEDILSEEEGDEDEVEEVLKRLKRLKKKMKMEVVEEEYDIEEDVNALLAGEDLSEEFQEKARTIFEAALRSKVSEIKESLEEQYSNVLAEEVEEIKTELADRVDSYLEYVADEWISENALAVEHGLKD